MGKYSLSKSERLHREKHIQELFAKGSSFYLFPFKVYVMPSVGQHGPDIGHQIMVSVSTRNFKKAVDRNLIKRRTREAYRLQKSVLPSQPNLTAAFVYAHKEILPFEELKSRLLSVLKKIPKAAHNRS
ncbi:ribonuclease P protein component [Pseudochryseolinea flava]|uniref:Ribonuclease P protein component n=1 Tax=Pseudochryseolinea flava TaxID=2059302 RepID=A0A364Y0C3_9BACT|nr:ribonuclease P protein component [Pseudochryseolinea flava]RAV99732.1 ribonuclease P protein component [Pseudochryseolinea flava]